MSGRLASSTCATNTGGDANSRVLAYLAARGGESRLDRVCEATGLTADDVLRGAAAITMKSPGATGRAWPPLAPISDDDESLLLG